MKKVKFLFMALFIAAAIVSCDMIPWNDIKSLGETPTLINKTPRLYPGGNAECSTINIPGLAETTGRNNYIPSTDGFEKSWPSGLLVKVDDDKSVSFQIEGSINLGDGNWYKVGAVIVKGSDASNVYNYTDNGGATMDKGLVAPNNSSGGPAGLSNLTFCFIKCEPQLVIAVKSLYWDSYVNGAWTGYNFALSSGSYDFTSSTGWCQTLGIVHYPETTTFFMHKAGYTIDNVGTVTVTKGIGNTLKVKVDLNDGMQLDKTNLFVGSMEGLLATMSNGCPVYDNWTSMIETDSNIHEFTVSY